MSNKYFTQTAQNALNIALAAARNMGHTYVGSEHILFGLASEKNGVASKILDSRGVNPEKIKQGIAEYSGIGEKNSTGAADLTPRSKRIIEYSWNEALSLGHNYIGTEHILLALIKERGSVADKILTDLGINVGLLNNDIIMFFTSSEYMSTQSDQQPAGAGVFQSGATPTGKAGGQTPALNQYGKDLTEAAKQNKIDPIIGRDNEMERVIQILSRRTKNNPCLIGEPGVGKTAVVEGLAQRIIDGRVPENLTGKRLITLDISAMVAGAKYRGEFEERMKNIMEEIKRSPNIIIFIDEIHTIVGAGAAEGAVDAANILKPALSRGEIQIIGATTLGEYRKHIEKDAALERRFQSVMVGEPTEDETIMIIEGLRDKYEAHHKVKITDEAIKAAVGMSKRYINDRFLPDKAIDLIDEASSKKRIGAMSLPPDLVELEEKVKRLSSEKEEAIRGQEFERAARIRDEEKKSREELESFHKNAKDKSDKAQLSINAGDIADIVTSWTGIPVRQMESEEVKKLQNLEQILKEQIIGQDEAVSAVAKAIKRSRVGLKDPRRPTGSFIFLGPTGVGKTELSKALARVLFGDESAIIRVDMSEYMEKHSVSKLIGSPPGYVGYDEAGQLTEKVRRRPYSIVLFDEIEKAHPDVFNILLQILEDGNLTDAHGRKVDFKNTVVIMTSNVGAGSIVEPKTLGFSADSAKNDTAKQNEGIMSALKLTFRPEFLNRLDEIIIFRKLTEESIKRITVNMLKEIQKRIEGMNIQISFDEQTVEFLAKEGFDPVYGARPLRRAIQRKLEDGFSTVMLEGIFKPGDHVVSYVENGEIKYRKK
ncbi:MAG: ATP-dependent Clp protease ATP-binding subunit [Eubacteriales bacterium]